MRPSLMCGTPWQFPFWLFNSGWFGITRFVTFSVLVGLLLLQVAHAQGLPSSELGPSDEFSEAIEDNSFFIEEAYNQEQGVVQHIFNGTSFASPEREVVLAFTQEWPIGSQAHQLSFTVQDFVLNTRGFSGIGDVLVNYRYQLFSSNDWAAVAPRISMVLPTGSFGKALGGGVVGAQVNLPASKRLSEHLAAHVNLGVTVLPGTKGVDAAGSEVKRTISSINVGGSLVVLASTQLNILLEATENFLSEMGANGEVDRTRLAILSPGMRCAIDVDQLQIVPGVAIPVVFNAGERNVGVFFYLSLEHPF